MLLAEPHSRMSQRLDMKEHSAFSYTAEAQLSCLQPKGAPTQSAQISLTRDSHLSIALETATATAPGHPAISQGALWELAWLLVLLLGVTGEQD